MMTWTLRPYHGRFTHKLIIDTSVSGDDPVAYCRQHHGKDWRKLNHYDRRQGYKRRHAVTIYCLAKAYADLMQRYADAIKHHSRPVDQRHGELLQQGVELVIKDRPWFGRYHWSLQMWSNRRQPLELQRWANQAFDGDRSQYHVRGRWFPVIYLRDEAALTMVKLAIPERICLTRKVVLLRELPEH